MVRPVDESAPAIYYHRTMSRHAYFTFFGFYASRLAGRGWRGARD